MTKKMVIIAAAATAVLAGCAKIENDKDIDKAWIDHGVGCCTKVIEVEGHKYIIMDGSYSGCIIHAESCPCKK